VVVIQTGQANAPAYRLAKIERGPIAATIASTGTFNPVTSVQVGTQVSGQIRELYVDFNSPVKQGQLIARIDPETFQYRVRQAEADLEATRSAVGRAQVSLINAERDLKRTRELVERNFVSPAELDRAQSTYDLAAAEVRTAQAVVAQRAAQLATARVDLSRTEIRAPVDGVVIKRSVDVGQTVAASLQAPELFVIAKDLRDMQVDTSIDEADVGRVSVGQRATFTVDAFPGPPVFRRSAFGAQGRADDPERRYLHRDHLGAQRARRSAARHDRQRPHRHRGPRWLC
jgi:HlyD family secretion protein